jgi:hypothetical protein
LKNSLTLLREVANTLEYKAVRWAITKEVHIISMSWAIESSRSASDILEFHKAVKEAEEKDIIMFCAFSDQGNVSSTDCFPSEFTETLTVGAATALGHPCTWVNKELVQLLLPGEHIIIEANPTSPSKPESGSSMATALAAGLAALLLYITQLVKPDAYEQLRKPKEMKDRLMKVGGTEKYIPAKDLFRLEFKDDPKWRWNSRTNLGKEKMGFLVSKFTVSNALSPLKQFFPRADNARFWIPWLTASLGMSEGFDRNPSMKLYVCPNYAFLCPSFRCPVQFMIGYQIKCSLSQQAHCILLCQ